MSEDLREMLTVNWFEGNKRVDREIAAGYRANLDLMKEEHCQSKSNSYLPLLQIYTEVSKETPDEDLNKISKSNSLEESIPDSNQSNKANSKKSCEVKKPQSKIYRSKISLKRESFRNELYTKKKVSCCFACHSLLTKCYQNRQKVVTFKGPKEQAIVTHLLEVLNKDWNRTHFKKLLELYSFRFAEVNNSEADKFIKSIKTSFLYQDEEKKKAKSKKEHNIPASTRADYAKLKEERAKILDSYETARLRPRSQPKQKIIQNKSRSKRVSESGSLISTKYGIGTFRTSQRNFKPVRVSSKDDKNLSKCKAQLHQYITIDGRRNTAQNTLS